MIFGSDAEVGTANAEGAGQVSDVKYCPVCGERFLFGTYSSRFELSVCGEDCIRTMIREGWGWPIKFEVGNAVD